MSIFGKIASAIFGHHANVPGATAATGSLAKPSSTGTVTMGTTSTAPLPGATGKPMTTAEVEAMIAKVAAGQKEKLDWQKSIVDLMKLLNLDSSLHARTELAKELGYTGTLDGSAQMNIWLHKQVMTKLAESGGKVPESLKV